jgi:hypothetical protein
MQEVTFYTAIVNSYMHSFDVFILYSAEWNAQYSVCTPHLLAGATAVMYHAHFQQTKLCIEAPPPSPSPSPNRPPTFIVSKELSDIMIHVMIMDDKGIWFFIVQAVQLTRNRNFLHYYIVTVIYSGTPIPPPR